MLKIQQDLFGFACISRKISIFAALNRTEAAGKADNLKHSQAKGRQETAKTLKPMGRWDRTGEKEKMKNTSRTFPLFLTALLLLCGSLAFGQDRTLQTEDDGFKWYELRQNGYCGAQSTNGTTLIPLSRKYTFICYHLTRGGWFSFRKNNSSTYQGCCDKNGREIIAVERGYTRVHYRGDEGYIGVEKNGLEGACDLNGKEIIAVERGYNSVTYYDDGYYGVEKNGLEGACDLNGKEIVAPKYESLFLSSSSGEFEYKNSQGEWISTGIKYDGKTDAYASASSSSSSSSSASSSSSNSSSSSSNSASGNTESKLLYEGDYTEGSTFVNGWGTTSQNVTAGMVHHIKIYEDHLEDCPNNMSPFCYEYKWTTNGSKVYSGFVGSFIVDYYYNITKDIGAGVRCQWSKGNVAYNINAPVQNNGGGNYGSGNYNNGSYNSGTSNTNNSGPSQVKCSYCNGTGKVAKNTYPPQFGTQDYKVRCPECGEEHWKSDGHVHVPCPSCNGRGYK